MSTYIIRIRWISVAILYTENQSQSRSFALILRMQNDQVHKLYQEQQLWFAQFQKPQQVQQKPLQAPDLYVEELSTLAGMGFKKHHRNLRLLKQFNGNLDCVVQKLLGERTTKMKEEANWPDLILNTQTLILDCNNMKYAQKKWNKFHGKPLKQILKALKICLFWARQENSKLAHITLVWDVLNLKVFKKLPKKAQKCKQAFVAEMATQVTSQDFSEIARFQITTEAGLPLSVTVFQTKPQIADDYIVQMLQGQANEHTTVVTSDRGLRDRLSQIQVTKFLGSGKFWQTREILDPRENQ